MVHIRPEYLPKNIFKKLHAWAIDSFPVIRKLGPNAYLLEFPSHINFSSIFNAENLLVYWDIFESPTLSSSILVGTS